MSDERHGIEVGIDSSDAKRGENEVVRSLDNIKKKTREVGDEGEKAGKRSGDGLGKAAGGADKAARSMDNIRAKAKGAGDAGQSSGERTAQAWKRATDSMDRATFVAARAHAPLRDIEATMNRTRRMTPFEAMDRSMPNVIGNLTSVRNLLLGIGAIAVGQEIARTAVQFKGFNQALTIVTGSAQGARDEMAFAEGVANKLGFRIRDVTQQYVGLAAAAQGTALEGENSRHVFESITRAAAAYGLTNEQLKGSLLAVQQMIGKGTVSAEELRGQLGERLPGAVQIAARAMNMTTQELFKMMEQGQLTSDVFLKRFADQLDREIPKGARSANAAFNEFLSQLDKAKLALAEGGLFEGMARGAAALAGSLQQLADNGSLAAIGSAIGGVLETLGSLLGVLKYATAAFVAYFAVIKVQQIAAIASQFLALEFALGASSKSAAVLGVTMKGLQAVMRTVLGPIALIVGAVTAAVAIYDHLSSNAERTRKVMEDSNNTYRDSVDALSQANQWGKQAASTIADTGTDAASAEPKIRNFAGAVGDAAQELYNLARARQADMISSLEAKRQQASLQYSELYGQTTAGRQARNQAGRNQIANAGSLKDFFGGVLEAIKPSLEAAWDGGAQDPELLQKMEMLKESMGNFDKAIQKANENLEAFAPKPDAVTPGKNKPGTNKNYETRQSWSMDDVKKMITGAGGNITSGLRSFATQKRLHDEWVAGGRKGQEPAKPGTSFHERGQAVDITGMTIEQVRKAVKGLPIKELINEGDHVHLAWGKAGDAMSDANRELERQLDLAEQRKEREAEYWEQLKNEAKVAGLLPGEAEKFNKELELRTILNDGVLAGAKELTAEQKQQISDAVDLANKNRLIADAQLAGKTALIEQTKLLDDQKALAAGNADAVEDELELNNRLWRFKEMALLTGVKLTDETVKKALEELAIRERTNIEIARKNALIQKGNDIVDSANERTDPYLSTRRRYAEDRGAIENSTRSRAQKDAAIAQLTKEFDRQMNEITDEFYDEMMGHISDIGDAIGGAFGQAVEAAMSIASIMSQMASQGYQAGTVGAGSDSPIARIATGLQGISQNLVNVFGAGTAKGKFFHGLQDTLGKFGDGAAMGGQIASLAKAIGFKKFSSTGSQIGGAIGSFLPIPGGDIIGSIIGGLIGGLFKKTKWGRVTLGSGGNLVTEGNSGKAEKASLQMGNNIMDGLSQLAKSLGGSVGSFGNITIGVRDGDWRVNTGGTSLKKKNGAKDFNDDAEAAMRYALIEALKRGAVTGISEASDRVLKRVTDATLDSTVEAIQVYEQLAKAAKRSADPAVAAWEEFLDQTKDTMKLLKDAGYSYNDLMQLQTLFQKQQQELLKELTAGYKEFLEAITKGPDSGLTIFQQFQNALTDFRKMEATGGYTQDEFTEAGSRLFDLARQVYGSATPEFEAIKAELVAATQGAIDDVTSAAQAALDSAGIIGAINTGTGEQQQTNNLLELILKQLYGTTGSSTGTGSTTPTSGTSVGGGYGGWTGAIGGWAGYHY